MDSIFVKPHLCDEMNREDFRSDTVRRDLERVIILSDHREAEEYAEGRWTRAMVFFLYKQSTDGCFEKQTTIYFGADFDVIRFAQVLHI